MFYEGMKVLILRLVIWRIIMKLRKIVLFATILSAIICIFIIGSWYVYPIYLLSSLGLSLDLDFSDVAAIGFIGAADGPTSILVSNSDTSKLLVTIPMIITLAGCIYLIKTKRKKQ